MHDLTLKQVDAAIRRELRKRDCEFEPSVCSGPVAGVTFDDLRAVAFLGMQAAERIDSGLDVSSFAVAVHKAKIRAAIRRLRKEAKSNG